MLVSRSHGSRDCVLGVSHDGQRGGDPTCRASGAGLPAWGLLALGAHRSIAKNAGMDRWAFTKKTCELLREKGVDSIWLVNIGVRESEAAAQDHSSPRAEARALPE